MSDELNEGGFEPIKVSLKAGPGYEDPWVTVTAKTPQEAVLRLDGLAQAAVLAKAAEVAAEFHGLYNAVRGLGAKTTQVEGTQPSAGGWGAASTPAPTPATAAPAAGSPVPQCQHGARVYKTGRSQKGPWAAWFCPRPKGAADACAPEWV